MNPTASPSPTVADFLSVDTPSELRMLGHFNVLKASLSAALGLTVATRSWDALYALVSDIQTTIKSDPSIRSTAPYPASEAVRSKLSTVLMSATSVKGPLVNYDAALAHAVIQLVAAARDPAARFQASRTRNFQHSSRLEGIDMRKAKPAESLQTVLNRYRKR
ncbi:hypothetical protein J7J08_12050 [Stenotrophomonas sp. ISL-67]|uniref:YhfG family protein n=1 Tax=Stenotrophomonas sp. ISL-67 TaxID=2819171 RepID=UPI001BEAD202|nr:YhfG family protein [Stenotrophomonas sp. ISL-67]MBT2768372.1 hypothetical protein [Stenotrophomonas sp. ISL-67]